MTKPKHPSEYKKIGRPGWEYEETLADSICQVIATSSDSLKTIVSSNAGFPPVEVIYKWVLQVPDFAKKYEHARQCQQECLVQWVVDECRDDTLDMYPDDKGVMRPNMARIARHKLIADNVKWTAGRLSTRYREKSTVEQHTYTHEDGLKELA